VAGNAQGSTVAEAATGAGDEGNRGHVNISFDVGRIGYSLAPAA
jgi:hypothetical protein